MDIPVRVLSLTALCLAVGCTGPASRQGTIEEQRVVNVATSQPASISQDQAAVMAKLDAIMKATVEVRTEVVGIRSTSFYKKTYGDMTLGGIAIVLSFLLFVVSCVYAGSRAKAHGYWRQREHRIRSEMAPGRLVR